MSKKLKKVCNIFCVFLLSLSLLICGDGRPFGFCTRAAADTPNTYSVVPVGDFAAQLASFPESYRAGLIALHNSYPNWSFIADYVDIDFNTALYNQTLEHRKLVSMNDGNSWKALGSNYNWSTGTWYTYSGNWTDASREVIAYYMDPRNFLTVTDIFMFARQNFDFASLPEGEYEKIEAGVAEMAKNTYLAKPYDDPNDTAYGGSYIKVIMEAAKQSGVNPYVLTSTLILEQGVNGSSDLISGKSGYYNFFNYGASGSDVIGNGIAFAKSQGWTSRSLSIIGGAKRYASGYINAGQDTYYYKDFDILDSNPYTHQYAQSIYDAKSSASRLRTQYISKYDAYLTFRIPVYKNMYETPPAQPPENSNLNNYYFTSVQGGALSPAFSMYNTNYTMAVSGDTTLNVKYPDTASYAGPASFELSAGVNTVILNVKSQSGYLNSYKITVTASAPCKLYITTDQKKITKGDANGDDMVDIIDLAAVRMHLLGLRTLSGDGLLGGDANGDGTVDIIDLAAVRMHILGLLNLN